MKRFLTCLAAALLTAFFPGRSVAGTPMPQRVDNMVLDGARAAIEEHHPEIDITRIIFMGWEDDGSLSFVYLDDKGDPVKKNIPNVRPIAVSTEKEPATGQMNQDGRIYFMAHTAAKSLYVYPFTYGQLFYDADARVISGLVLASFGGSLFASYKFTQNRQLGYGRVAMMNYGGELAISYANLVGVLAAALEPEEKEDTAGIYTEDEDRPGASEYLQAVINLVGFPAGIWAGSRFTPFPDMPYGQTAFMKYCGRAGIGYGFLLPALFYSFDDEKDYDSYLTVSTVTAMALIPAGNWLGYRLIRNRKLSSGRSFMIETAGVMGGGTGAALPSLWEDDKKNAYLIGTALGQLGGTVFALYYRPGESYRFSQGVFTALSAAAGSAVAMSIPLLAQADNHRAYTTAGIIGGWAGYLFGERLARSIFEKSGRDDHTSVQIDFPILSTLPAAAAAALHNGKDFRFASDIVSVRF